MTRAPHLHLTRFGRRHTITPLIHALGFNVDADWTWTGHRRGLAMDWTRTRTWTGHGLELGRFGWTRRGHCASIMRPLRGHKILRWLRGRAYVGLKMTGNGLFLRLNNFIQPVGQLRGGGLYVADLMNSPSSHTTSLLPSFKTAAVALAWTWTYDVFGLVAARSCPWPVHGHGQFMVTVWPCWRP